MLAIVITFLVRDRWGALAAAILVLLSVGLRRWNARQAGKTFTILSDGTWQPPGCITPKRLSPSSVDLGGILWLHGCRDDGRSCALMVLPDACESPHFRRCLRIWFHHFARSAEGVEPKAI